MSNDQIREHWLEVAGERRDLINETRALCSERRAIIEQRCRLLRDYMRLGNAMQGARPRVTD